MERSSAATLARDISALVRAGTPKDEIRAEMAARVTGEWAEACAVFPSMTSLPGKLLDAAFARALPLDAREAEGRRRKAERQKEMARQPEGILARAGKTRSQLRHELLREMKRRDEFGLVFSQRGFLPFSPHGERLVRDGLATLTRTGSDRSRHTMLRITPKGEKELARLDRKRGA